MAARESGLVVADRTRPSDDPAETTGDEGRTGGRGSRGETGPPIAREQDENGDDTTERRTKALCGGRQRPPETRAIGDRIAQRLPDLSVECPESHHAPIMPHASGGRSAVGTPVTAAATPTVSPPRDG